MKKINLSMSHFVWTVVLLGIITTAPACAQKENVESESGKLKVQTIAKDLNHPWGMAFLPDGRLLVTERAGQLRIVDNNNNLSEPVQGTPQVFARGQGGLLDVALHPDFKTNRMVYLSFAEPGANNTASTALGRGRLQNGRIEDFEVVFSQKPKVKGESHFGGRIVFHQANVYLTMGDRVKAELAQDLSNHLGSIVRLNYDGSVPQDNPFVGQQAAEDEIWSYGHRNIEAAGIDPNTGLLWEAEMGPRGGDELNQPEAGKNYGWPVVSWGQNYDGSPIPDPPTRPEFADAAIHWTPVISPSGMEFYTADMFPDWQNKMLLGGLSSQAVVIVDVKGQQSSEVNRLEMNARIRDVEQAADGSVYLLTDDSDGKVLRLVK